jgi:hypothetical protein
MNQIAALLSISQADCEAFPPETIWNQCWWINNVKWLTAILFFTIWFGPVYVIIRRPDPASTFRWNLVALAWLFVGGPVAIVISMLLVEPLVLSMLGAS